jgi:hypothetical protein
MSVSTIPSDPKCRSLLYVSGGKFATSGKTLPVKVMGWCYTNVGIVLYNHAMLYC